MENKSVTTRVRFGVEPGGVFLFVCFLVVIEEFCIFLVVVTPVWNFIVLYTTTSNKDLVKTKQGLLFN